MGSTSDSTEDLLNYIYTLTTNNKQDGFRLRNVSRDEVYHVTRNTCMQQPLAFISKHCVNMKYFRLYQQ